MSSSRHDSRGRIAASLLFLLPISAIAQDKSVPPEGDARPPLPAAAERPIDFVVDVQPIFQAKCYSCHNGDEQEGGFRLDIGARALAGGDSGRAILPGKGGESQLVLRAAGVGEEDRMPPEDEGTPLTDGEVSILLAWIDQGASWPKSADADQLSANHWAFQAISEPPLPDVKDASIGRNGIDAFILRRLQQEGITLSPPADRATLIRRVHLDLIGLPPSPTEMQKWLNDSRQDWYDHLVDTLLDSPHYGERWARHWLDLARYADSDGYEKDKPRPHAWRWRDWVIQALNDNMPFDQFTIQQIAGDLLPDATLEQRVATGFHRNTLINREGGTDPEEDRFKRTVDRTNTIGKVWLGLTVECAQCHSHKYDPLPQGEYYQLYAFFNTLAEPDIGAPLPIELERYELAKKKFDVEHQPYVDAISEYEKDKFESALEKWQQANAASEPVWQILRPESVQAKKGTTLEVLEDGSVLASGKHPGRQEIYTVVFKTQLKGITGLRIEALTDDRLPGGGPGRGPLGDFHITRFDVEATPTDGSAKSESVKLSEASATFSAPGSEVAKAINDNPESNGWSIGPRVGEKHMATFKTLAPFGFDEGTQIQVSIWQSSVLRHFHGLGKFRISITTTAGKEKQPLPLLGISDAVTNTIATPSEQRSSVMRQELRDYYRLVDPQLIKLRAEADGHLKKAPANPYQSTKAQVIEEMRSPRKTHLLVRGDFLSPDYEVTASTPTAFIPLKPRAEKADRLDLARWLVDPEHPLTARVTVNRIWDRHFGRGIVPTVKDFGTQGAKPSHPELLDWLATWFQKNDWDLKALHKLIVTSATYRQSSHDRPDCRDRDPLNEWMSHQNRLRLEGEIVRDAALSVSGLIEHKVGGPSVRPPQPDGVAGLGYAGSVKWKTSDGADRYRRGLYTFFQRTVPYPMLMTFDAPDSNLSCVRRDRSNTPLQALTLWNDPVFFECSQALGRRIVHERTATGMTDSDGPQNVTERRIRFAFQTCLNRDPTDSDLAVVGEFLDTQTRLLKADVAAARAIADDDDLTDQQAIELAVWITVGRTILNLDEFFTRG